MAAKLRRELQIDVEMVHGRYGELEVLVDGETVADGGALAALGGPLSARKVLASVRQRLAAAGALAGETQ